MFSNKVNGDGLYDPNTKAIIINPNALLGELSTLIHELTHVTESSGEHYKALAKLVKNFLAVTVLFYRLF